VRSVLVRQQAAGPAQRTRRTWLLGAGAAAFVVAVGLYAVYAAIHPYNWTLDPVDLAVYRSGGLIVRHIRPDYNPHLYDPLYEWGGYGALKLPFTYTPFAAVVFSVVSFVPWGVLPRLSVGVNILALVAALWFMFGGLGYRDRPRVRLGATLLAAGAVFWTEPIIRTMYLGQVNLVLMALIMWDLCQPDTEKSRWWKGIGTGVAAGIKLVPLIYVPYLFFARKYRQAFNTCVGFLLTVLIGFVIQRHDSVKWWFSGLFFQGGRTGFPGWEGNQSLQGIVVRLVGSVAGAKIDYYIAALLIGILGIACAAMLDRAGHQVAGLLTAALTGLLLSPISWDHHWVWIAPGVALAGYYAARSWRTARARALALWAVAAGILAVYAAWPGSLWGEPTDLGPFSLGVIWQPPNTDPATYYAKGDQPWFVEYHWHGIQLITGNAFILGGLALLAVVAIAALRLSVFQAPAAAAAAGPDTTASVPAEPAASPASAAGRDAEAKGQDVDPSGQGTQPNGSSAASGDRTVTAGGDGRPGPD